MNHTYTAKNEYISLKPMSADDSEKYRVVRNNNIEWFGTNSQISIDQQAIWYSKYLNSQTELMFSIYDKKDRFIGGCSLYNIDKKRRIAEFGRIVIDKISTGHGYGYYATIAAMEIANRINLSTVKLDVRENNIKAIKTYIRAGFTQNVVYNDSEGKPWIQMTIKFD